MDKNEYRITILYAITPGDACDKAFYYYKFHKYGPRGSFLKIKTTGDATTQIIQHLKGWETECDFVVAAFM